MATAPIRPFLQSFNPTSDDLHLNPGPLPVNEVLLLSSYCIKNIRKQLGIKRFCQAATLPLPTAIIEDNITKLCLKDFVIDPGEVSGENYQEQSFPAHCLIDDTRVTLELVSPDQDAITTEPSFLTSFTCQGYSICVHECTVTLSDKIDKIRESMETVPETFIWQTIQQLVLCSSNLELTFQLTPKVVHYKDDETIFIRRRAPITDDDRTQIVNSTAVAFYEAPEQLMRQPVTDRTRSWSIGCIAYEIAALQPAFYDREHTGNVMAVMTAITQGSLPPKLPEQYSADLKNLITQCLATTYSGRPSLDQIGQMARNNISDD